LFTAGDYKKKDQPGSIEEQQAGQDQEIEDKK
jgi:hypothetical protein